MEEFDKLKWAAIFSLLGIILGWTLNQFSNWYKSRIEDKRILKKSLFHLLEIYFNLSRSNFEEIADKALKEIFPDIYKQKKPSAFEFGTAVTQRI